MNTNDAVTYTFLLFIAALALTGLICLGVVDIQEQRKHKGTLNMNFGTVHVARHKRVR